jgi:TonB family protein
MAHRDNLYMERYSAGRPLRWAILFSVVLHVAAVVLLWWIPLRNERITPQTFNEVTFFASVKPATTEVPVLPPPAPDPEPEPVPPPPEPQPPKPEPEPVPPPPEPEPPKPEPEPEPVRVAAVQKPEPPKPEPPKETPKPKPEPPKPKPQPLALKEPEPEIRPLQMLDRLEPIEPVMESNITMKFSAQADVLDTWGALAKRKIESRWVAPGGVSLASNEALVSFWVDRGGNLLEEPQVLRHAADRSVGESAVRAIKLAAPFPPLPKQFTEPEVNVTIAFRVQ